MEVVVFFAVICIFAVAMPQAYAEEEEELSVREARRIRGAKACIRDTDCDIGLCDPQSHTCKCLPGYAGYKCRTPPHCTRNSDCIHGKCIRYWCKCYKGYTGTNCE
ncbi:hypothetical protein LSAT2_012650, partial [Lamellibrachia satsuma]